MSRPAGAAQPFSILRRIALKFFPSRSKAIQDAVGEKLERVNRSRLARESAKLDPKFEQTTAKEGMSRELAEWPEH